MPQVTEERELIRAQARYVRSSARKARLVLEHIRGKPAVEAQSILAFQTRAVARDAGKVLKSAIANAENNSGHDADELVVVYAYADEGPTLKRWRARARGRVNRIRKRTCHITITLSPALPGEIKPRPERRPRPADEAPAESREAEAPPQGRGAPKAEAATAETAVEAPRRRQPSRRRSRQTGAEAGRPRPSPSGGASRPRRPSRRPPRPRRSRRLPPSRSPSPSPSRSAEPATEEPSDTDTDDDSKEADS